MFTAVELTDYTKLIEKVAKQLHDGTLKPADLNSDLLTTILGDVKGALADGYGKSFYNYDENAKNKLQLKQNLYRFSGAKTYQEIAKINYFSQQSRSFADFKKEALKINKEYNVQYLETEYINANRQGAMAEKWHKAVSQKDLYPNLQYKTVKDNRVRLEHAQLHDVIKPIDDAFWDTWMPQNGHRCRCYVVQTDSPTTAGTPEGNPTPGFHGNVGKNNMAFNENEHPYFIFPSEDAKKIKASFEDMKISTPDYNIVHTNKKATLEVSTWADPGDIELNHKYAKILVDKLGISVKLRPHSEIEKTKNPEYLINGFVSDLKSPESNNGIGTQFKKSKEQMGTITNSYSIVFNLDLIKELDHNVIITQIENKVSANRGKKITSLFFVRNGKAVELTRESILKKDYTKFKSFK